MVPTGLIIARSSDAVATGDTQVSEALRYIREHAAQPLAVAEVASSAHLSRRVLEKRFRRQLGRSVFDEIRDQQIAHVRVLLLDTNLPLEEVCARSAFANVSHMTSAFRKRVGLAPGHFRKQEPAPFL